MTPPSHDIDTLAAGELDDFDMATLQRMAALYDRLDPVPSELIDRVKFELTLEALHAEVAELQSIDALAGVRSDGAVEAQTITFTSSALTTMITISPAGPSHVRVDGWVAPGAAVDVELRMGDAVRTTSADADGRFAFDDVPHGLARFVLRPPGADPTGVVVTPSVEL